MVLYKKYRWFRDHNLPVRIIICKSRRAGLSTGVESLIFDDTITHPNTNSLIVANERNPAENILKMTTRFWQEMPEYFDVDGSRIQVRPPMPATFNNNPPKDRLILDKPLDSGIYVASAKSLDAYLGYQFQNIHATEASRYADAPELFRAIYPTLSRHEHSALYIESTPAGQEGKGAWFYEQCWDAYERKDTQYGEMALVFIPWHEMRYSFAIPFKEATKREQFIRSYTKTEKELLNRFPHISAEQFQWRRMVLSGPPFNRDEDIFDQEYPTDLATAFLVSGASVFGRKTIKRLMNQTREPIWTGDIFWGESDEHNQFAPPYEAVRRPKFLTRGQAMQDGWKSHTNERTYNNLKVWRWPKKGERLFAACDVGRGLPDSRDGDYSTICVGVLNEFDRDELIMTWKGRLNPVLFGELASALCHALVRMVGDDCVAPELVPEWTGPGISMCTYIDAKHLYPHLYRYETPGVHGMPKSKHVGWESNFKTKPMAVGYTRRMVEADQIDIPDADLVTQMGSYKETGDDEYNGAAGRHDDLVSAFLILCAIMKLRRKTLPGDDTPMQNRPVRRG